MGGFGKGCCVERGWKVKDTEGMALGATGNPWSEGKMAVGPCRDIR